MEILPSGQTTVDNIIFWPDRWIELERKKSPDGKLMLCEASGRRKTSCAVAVAVAVAVRPASAAGDGAQALTPGGLYTSSRESI
jgi:hypothetical protein